MFLAERPHVFMFITNTEQEVTRSRVTQTVTSINNVELFEVD